MDLLRNGVVAMAAPGVAADYSFGGKPEAFEEAIFIKCFKGVLGTGGCISATGRKHGRYYPLIQFNYCYKWEAKQPEYCFHSPCL